VICSLLSGRLAVKAGQLSPGIFEPTTYIQRVNTVGGLAPSTPGTVVGEEARVPYAAEYFFYRGKANHTLSREQAACSHE